MKIMLELSAPALARELYTVYNEARISLAQPGGPLAWAALDPRDKAFWSQVAIKFLKRRQAETALFGEAKL